MWTSPDVHRPVVTLGLGYAKSLIVAINAEGKGRRSKTIGPNRRSHPCKFLCPPLCPRETDNAV